MTELEALKKSMELNKKLIDKMSNEMFDFVKEYISLEDECKDIQERHDAKPELIKRVEVEKETVVSDPEPGPLDSPTPDRMIPDPPKREEEKKTTKPKKDPLF